MKNHSIKREPDSLTPFFLQGVNPLKPPGDERDLQTEFLQYSTKHPGVTWHEIVECVPAYGMGVFDLNEFTRNKSLVKLSWHGKTADTSSLIPPPAAGSDAGPPTSGHRAGTSDLDVAIECLRKTRVVQLTSLLIQGRTPTVCCKSNALKNHIE